MFLNGDFEIVGEITAKEKEFIKQLDIINIPCGAHTGNSESIKKAISIAKLCGAKISAHPSYNDKENFGRKSLFLSKKQLKKELLSQLEKLNQLCKIEQTSFNFVKPHGALYNDSLKITEAFAAIAESIAEYNSNLKWLFLGTKSNDSYEKKAKKYGLTLLFEAFPDRAYKSDRLLPRNNSAAIIQNTEHIVDRALALKKKKPIKDYLGNNLLLKVQTICLHSDNPASLESAKLIREQWSN